MASEDELRLRISRAMNAWATGRVTTISLADAVIPVVVEALADAWDEGAEAAYEWQIGVTGKPDNPWREDQP